jgi:hypothetical protein
VPKVKKIKILSSVFAAIAAAAFVSTPAHADDFKYPMHTDGDCGHSYFAPYGDRVLVIDTCKDGRSVVARWETNYGRFGECKNTAGTAGSGQVTCNYDMRETGYFRYKVCLRNYSNDIGWEDCSTWSSEPNIYGWIPINA